VDKQERAALEAEVAALRERGDFDAAATATIEGYGPELFSLVLTLVGDEQDSADVFSSVCERVWRGLPGFEGRASLRTWSYQLTRHEIASYQRRHIRRRQRHVNDSSVISKLEQRVRTATLSYLRSTVKTRIAELRSSLPIDDQTLLILRIDRQMEWNDIVTVLHDGLAPDEETVKRESARLRKSFQTVRERLRELAKNEGLIDKE
jgi:RNA polymerase sigma-70 factor, ECF subfamily